MEHRFTVGQHIHVPCHYSQGTFPHEWIVTIVTDEGSFSGFAERRHIRELQAPVGVIYGVILEADEETILVQVPMDLVSSSSGKIRVHAVWAVDNIVPPHFLKMWSERMEKFRELEEIITSLKGKQVRHRFEGFSNGTALFLVGLFLCLLFFAMVQS